MKNPLQSVVTQRFVGVVTLGTLNASTTVNSLVDMSPTTTGLGAISAEIAAFIDMYRECRLDKASLVFPCPAAISASGTFQPRVFMVNQNGASTPTFLTLETPLMSEIVDGFVYLSSGDLVPTPNLTGRLKFKGSDLVMLSAASGPGGDANGWIATQGDGSTTGFCVIYSVASAAGSAITYTQLMRFDITLSFRVLVDPSQISSAKLAARVQRELAMLKTLDDKTTCPVDGSTTGETPGTVVPVETAPIKTVAAERAGNSGTAVAAWQTKPLGEYENPVIGTNDDLIAYRAFLELRRRKG